MECDRPQVAFGRSSRPARALGRPNPRRDRKSSKGKLVGRNLLTLMVFAAWRVSDSVMTLW